MDSMEFHGIHGIPWAKPIKNRKNLWPSRAGPDWFGGPDWALRPVWPAWAGLGSFNLCKLNGGSTAEVKESGWGWESTTASGWYENLVFQIYRAKTSLEGVIPPAGCQFNFASFEWRKCSGSERISLMMRIHYGCLYVQTSWCLLISIAIRTHIESMEVHGMHTGNWKEIGFHGIHGSGTRNWNLDTHELHGIHDGQGIALEFHWIVWTSMAFHRIPWNTMGFFGIPWSSIACHDIFWITLGYPWNSMDSMEIHWFPCNSMMESVEFHWIHWVLWNLIDSMESMEFHGLCQEKIKKKLAGQGRTGLYAWSGPPSPD